MCCRLELEPGVVGVAVHHHAGQLCALGEVEADDLSSRSCIFNIVLDNINVQGIQIIIITFRNQYTGCPDFNDCHKSM